MRRMINLVGVDLQGMSEARAILVGLDGIVIKT